MNHGKAAAGAVGREWRSGWPLVLCATIGIAVASINYPAVATMMRTITAAYGWSRAEVALGVTIITLAGPLTNLLAGAAADRFGPRRVALIGAPLFGLSYATFAWAGPALAGWYVACVVYAVCSNFSGPVVWTMGVVRHFRASRGLALALALSGSGVVSSLMPTIVLSLLDWAGLRGTFLVLAVSASLLMFLPTLLLFRDEGGGRAGRLAAAGAASLPGLSLKQALSTGTFWRLAIALLLVAAAVGTFLLHFQSMLIDAGMVPARAASAALIIGPMMITGRITTGLLFDRLPAPFVAALAFAVLIVACLLMLAFDGSMTMAVVAAAAIGLGMGAEVDVVAFLTSHYFGLRRYGVLFGLIMGTYGAGLGVGSAMAGEVFDRFGSYDPALVALALGCAVAGLLAATLGTPRAAATQVGAGGPETE